MRIKIEKVEAEISIMVHEGKEYCDVCNHCIISQSYAICLLHSKKIGKPIFDIRGIHVLRPAFCKTITLEKGK